VGKNTLPDQIILYTSNILIERLYCKVFLLLLFPYYSVPAKLSVYISTRNLCRLPNLASAVLAVACIGCLLSARVNPWIVFVIYPQRSATDRVVPGPSPNSGSRGPWSFLPVRSPACGYSIARFQDPHMRRDLEPSHHVFSVLGWPAAIALILSMICLVMS
jgi:hypothetical protein